MRVPFKIYADFECILRKSKVSKDVDENSSWTKKYQIHVPCEFGYKLVCVDDRFTKDVVIYRGEDCVNKFIKSILREHKYCRDVMKNYFNKNLIMSVEEEGAFHLSNKCWICSKLFDLVDEKVRDHCYVSGKFRGAANFSCNANFKISKKVPVVFHNLKGYDGHLIMKKLSNSDVVIDIISNGLEKHMAFIVNRNLVFIDSMQFMNFSLDSLVGSLVDEDLNNLSKECEDKSFKLVKYLHKHVDSFKKFAEYEFDDKCLGLIKEKGVYPYEYMDSFKKFDECELPDKDVFFSSLNGVGITDEDYLKAKSVWDVFGIKNLGEYHDLYLKTDVLLLCDVFERFINVCLEYYGWDPRHYFSSPGLAWGAMLKMTGLS